MTSVRFKIRRSSTYNGVVTSIPAAVGELVSITTNSNNYTTQVGHKLYVGTGTETNGQASNFETVGGSYYTQLLDGVAGVLAPTAAIITDANSRINGLSIATAGSLTLNNTANTFNVGLKAASSLAASYTLTLPTTPGTIGQMLTTDGTGILSWSSTANTNISLNTATAYSISDGTNNYIGINTTTSSNAITFGNPITVQNNIVKTNTANAYNVTDGANSYLKIDTTTATPLTTIGTGALAVTNGILSTVATTANLFNTGTTTVNLAGSATTVNIGAATGSTNINNNLVVTGTLTVNGSTELLNATNLSVQDSLIEMGRINNSIPVAATTFDIGLRMNYFDTSAKEASIFWQRSSGKFVLANNTTETGNVLTVSTPTISVNDYATLNLGSLHVTDFACATAGVAESIISYKTLNGVTGRHLEGVIADGGIF